MLLLLPRRSLRSQQVKIVRIRHLLLLQLDDVIEFQIWDNSVIGESGLGSIISRLVPSLVRLHDILLDLLRLGRLFDVLELAL